MIDQKDRKKKEDEYFARMELETRQKKLREQMKSMEKEEKERLRELHWMRCPKCGMEMLEIDFEGIKVDKCSSCHGLFFDHGEVNHVIEANKPGFLSRFTAIFKD